MAYEFDTTVLGGLPVTIEYDTTEYDNRDCGGAYNDVDDWSIVAVAGKICRKAPNWVYRRLAAIDREIILDECVTHLGGW